MGPTPPLIKIVTQGDRFQLYCTTEIRFDKRTTYEDDYDQASRPACRPPPGDWRDGTKPRRPAITIPVMIGPSTPFVGVASPTEAHYVMHDAD
jgi:hypothetical protein